MNKFFLGILLIVFLTIISYGVFAHYKNCYVAENYTGETINGITSAEWRKFVSPTTETIVFTLKSEKPRISVYTSCAGENKTTYSYSQNDKKTAIASLSLKKGETIYFVFSSLPKESKFTFSSNLNNSSENTQPTQPKITILYQSPEVESGGILSFEWAVSGKYDSTGFEWGYLINKDNMNHKEAKKTSNNKYLALITPPRAKGNYDFFIRAYAIYNGKKVFSETKTIRIVHTELLKNNNDFSYKINEVNLAALGIEGAKILTIGNCIDNGLWDIWCALDIASMVTLASTIIQPELLVADKVILATKLGTIAKTTAILKGIKSGTQFAKVIGKVSFLYKDGKTFIRTGEEIGLLLDKGILTLASGEIKTSFAYTARYAIEINYSITNIIKLMDSGTNLSAIEKFIKIAGGKGNAVAQVAFATDKTVFAWYSTINGTMASKYRLEIQKALNLANDAEVLKLLKKMADYPEKIKSTTDGLEITNQFWIKGIPKYVKITINDIGKIITAKLV